MSAVIRIKPSNRVCPYVMHTKTPEGVMIGEHRCELPVDHPGMHRGGGLKWGNRAELEREMDPLKSNRPIITLPARH